METLEGINLTYTPRPTEEVPKLSDSLDYYKPTMSQLAYEIEPLAEVTFSFKNRGNQNIAEYVDAAVLSDRFEEIRSRGWSTKELSFLGGVSASSAEPVFSSDYLDFLKSKKMPEVKVDINSETKDLAIETTGAWPLVTFWETVVMSEVNEAYFEGYLKAKDLDPRDVYEEGDRRLSQKIEILKANPRIKFADFGTRRRFSYKWHKHVVERLAAECPENFIGTSNVGMAMDLGLRPIGTFAHEMPMVMAGLADLDGKDIRESHSQFLRDWFDRYGEDLSIALTDTFGSEFFFSDFSEAQARAWKGVRHDSGDPFEFGERLISFYEDQGIDPASKVVVFSDGLDIEQIVALYEQFKDRINVVFGWGTTLTNDLGIKALNIVMKATWVEGVETVKLSDNVGKHTGSLGQVSRYEEVFKP